MVNKQTILKAASAEDKTAERTYIGKDRNRSTKKGSQWSEVEESDASMGSGGDGESRDRVERELDKASHRHGRSRNSPQESGGFSRKEIVEVDGVQAGEILRYAERGDEERGFD